MTRLLLAVALLLGAALGWLARDVAEAWRWTR